jgi:hypothetical protein
LSSSSASVWAKRLTAPLCEKLRVCIIAHYGSQAGDP